MQAYCRRAGSGYTGSTADCIIDSGLIAALESYADMCARILCAAADNKPVRVRLQHQGAMHSTSELVYRLMYHNQ